MKPAWLAACAALWILAANAQAADPRLAVGTPLDAALAALNTRGHRIVYSSALVTPDMTLRTAPRSTQLEALLTEILAPWQLRAVPAANGDWLVIAAPPTPRSTSVPADALDVPELQTIDVTASRYALAMPGSSAVFLDRRGVEQMPHLADDAVRMLKVFPGVSGGDFSAALNIRGGRREETLLRIDGAEMHNGFHFRDLDGALSVLDTNLVDNIDFITGGMTAEHGDAMSGRVDLRTRRPRADDEYRSAAGVSFVSAYGRTGGAFANDRGAWLTSVRRGYLDVLMERVQNADEQITPRYTDVFSSVFYDVAEATSVAAHVLYSQDDLRLISRDEDPVDSAGEGRAVHAWVTLEQRIGAFESTSLVSTSTVRQSRDADGEEGQRSGDVDADFRFRFLDLRSDWTWTLDDRQLLRFGANLDRSSADYDYVLTGEQRIPLTPGGVVDISRAADLAVDGSRVGAHAAWRGRVGADVVVEAGARWDRYRYPDGLSFSSVSPRINAVWTRGPGELRGAWGVIAQPQGIHELQVEDGLTQFFGPERVRHSVLGYTHRFDHGLSARLDVYRKDYSHLRPRFENALDQMQLIPEGAVDRVRIDASAARASGIEATLRRESERGVAGWVSLAIAKTDEDVPGEGRVPRLWDQRRSLSFGLSWSGARWNLNLAGLYHSGTPTTRLYQRTLTLPDGRELAVVAAGPRNAERLGDYARLDLRASRAVQLRNVRFSYYLEVTNLLDRENPCCTESYEIESGPNGRSWLRVEESNWLPMLPSFGFQFEF